MLQWSGGHISYIHTSRDDYMVCFHQNARRELELESNTSNKIDFISRTVLDVMLCRNLANQ